MGISSKRTIAIIGAGKVGIAVGHLLYGQGYIVAEAVAISDESLARAARFLPEAHLSKDTAGATVNADIVLITTRDDQIQAVCEELAEAGSLHHGQAVVHMSGASSLEVLAAAREAGASIASIHPIQSFATVELAIEKIPGSYFGVTADETTRDVALTLVRDLEGVPIEIKDENKPLYHAAACIASNYLVALLFVAECVYKASGLSENISVEAMMPLVKGTLANIEGVGTVAALTGPIARGDVTNIEQHLKSLGNLGENVVDIYKVLGLRTVDIAVEKGTITAETARNLKATLKGGER